MPFHTILLVLETRVGAGGLGCPRAPQSGEEEEQMANLSAWEKGAGLTLLAWGSEKMSSELNSKYPVSVSWGNLKRVSLQQEAPDLHITIAQRFVGNWVGWVTCWEALMWRSLGQAR